MRIFWAKIAQAMSEKYRILVTGGHLTPALAVIDILRQEAEDSRGELNYDFVWLGRKYAQEKNGQLSHEQREMASRGITFIDLKTGKSNERRLTMLFKVLRATSQVKKLFRREHFDLVLSFGGYLAIPAARAARAMGIPIITHEQTRTLGRANRYIAPFADVLALSYPEEATLGLGLARAHQKLPVAASDDLPVGFFAGQKNLRRHPSRRSFPKRVVMTGNPLRADLFEINNQPPSWWPQNESVTNTSLPILYISGGSQGSQMLNRTVAPLIADLTQKYLVIHQVGAATAEHDFVAEYTQLARENNVRLDHYWVRSYLTLDELRYFYPRVSLALARSGANTVAELAAFQIPALYIPLPTAIFDEQQLNAQFYAEQGLALILPQNQLTVATLAQSLIELEQKAPLMRKKLAQLAINSVAATQKLGALIREVLTQNEKKSL